MRILLAEDNVVMARVLSFNLSRAGFDVHVCQNGRLALEAAQAESFALIITDYQMPEMNGEDLCRQIRQRPEYHHTPVILCSAKGFEIDAERMKAELGITSVIYKPFSPDHVIQLVRSHLEESRVPRTSEEPISVRQSPSQTAAVSG
jgi:CheY-like chemotaxis protein